MHTTVTTKITISSSIDQVFTYLSHLKHHYLWNPQLQSLSVTGPLTGGMKYSAKSRLFGTTLNAVNEVTKFQPPVELEIVNKVGNVQYRANFQLSSSNNETTVRLRTEVSTEIALVGLTLPVLKKLAARELRTDLQALKIAVENGLE